ncbi:MAG: cold shock domain-containing protein [Bacteroidales bacterium]
MTKGKIKWYNESKGYGFIITDEGKDVSFIKAAFT